MEQENLKNYYFDGDEKSIDYPVIVLDDPVGILKDIGQVMRYYKEKYNKNNEKDLYMDEKFSQIQLGVSRSCAASAYFEVEDYTKRGILANYKKGFNGFGDFSNVNMGDFGDIGDIFSQFMGEHF